MDNVATELEPEPAPDEPEVTLEDLFGPGSAHLGPVEEQAG